MVFTLLFIALIAPFVSAQSLITPVPQATHLTRLDNITLGPVNHIHQDRAGNIWLATTEGLVRFDGYNAKRFVHDENNPYSLSHNVVMNVIEDRFGHLWITTYGGGLNKYDPQTARFEKIDLHLGADDPYHTDLLYYLSIDHEDILWFGSVKGLKRVDIRTAQAIKLPKTLEALPKTAITKALIDHQQRLWIGTVYNGVYLFDRTVDHASAQTLNQTPDKTEHSNKLQNFRHNQADSNSLADDKVRSMHVDEHGTVWVATASSLHRFNPPNHTDKDDKAKGTFSRFLSSSHPEMDEFDSDIFAIQSDHQGKLWLGSLNRGVHTFNPTSEVFTPVSGKRDLNQQFKRSMIHHILRDKDGSLWFATDEGIVVLTHTAQQFHYMSHVSGELKVSDIKQLSTGDLAVVAGYNLYDIDLKQPTAQARTALPKRILHIVEDKSDNLWLATAGYGLQKHQSTKDKTFDYHQAKVREMDFSINNLAGLFIDNTNHIWTLLYPHPPHTIGGIARFFPHSGDYKLLMTNPNMKSVLQLTENELLFASDHGGLMTINTDTNQSNRWKPTIPSTPQRNNVLFKDSQGTLWVGTKGQGLARFNPKKQTFDFITNDDGLLSNHIISIAEDDDHRLWLGTPIGLSRFDTDDATILNLERQDGLMFTRFFPRAAMTTHDDQIVMGTYNGLVWFDPHSFDGVKISPKVVINDFKRFNQSVVLQSEDISSPLLKPIEFTDQLTLDHQDVIFSFGFSLPEYHRPDKIRFAYKMTGLNDQWQFTDAGNRIASYTTLPAGDYVFNVKASNSQGHWNNTVTSLGVTILPPWWLSWPAYIGYILLTIGAMAMFIRLRTQKLRQQAAILERNVAERTRELEQSRDELTTSNQQLAVQSQTVSELLTQKQQLFASVSHEFRTPLTLILSPVEQLLSQPKGQPISKELTLIKRSSHRLLRMVDQLLEFAKLEQHEDDNTELVSLKQTLNIIIASFESLVSSKHISLSITPYSDVTLLLIPDSLNKILINLLSNAFKYTPAHGNIWVDVNIIDNQVNIVVKDSGIGIDKDDHKTVFERFNRVLHHHGEAIPGAGIGLALVKELVEANQGQISLSSELDKGSTFTLSLPIASTEPLDAPSSQLSEQGIDLALEIDSIATVNDLVMTEIPDNANVVDGESQLKTLLIVDDNADMRSLLYDQLSNQYQCLVAEHGERGLNIAREQLPDLIVSDVMMPVMDGYELTRQLKENELTSHIPVILLTAKGSMASRLKGLQLLVDDYLAKPFNIEELRQRIHNILTIRAIVAKRFSQSVDASGFEHLNNKDADSGLSEVDQRFFDKLNQQLAECYDDPKFTSKLLCQTLGINEKQLTRKLKALLGLSFPEWVRSYRLNKACERLNQGHRVSQIYYEVGFSSHSYFSSCFKARFGVTPSQWIKK